MPPITYEDFTIGAFDGRGIVKKEKYWPRTLIYVLSKKPKSKDFVLILELDSTSFNFGNSTYYGNSFVF